MGDPVIVGYRIEHFHFFVTPIPVRPIDEVGALGERSSICASCAYRAAYQTVRTEDDAGLAHCFFLRTR